MFQKKNLSYFISLLLFVLVILIIGYFLNHILHTISFIQKIMNIDIRYFILSNELIPLISKDVLGYIGNDSKELSYENFYTTVEIAHIEELKRLITTIQQSSFVCLLLLLLCLIIYKIKSYSFKSILEFYFKILRQFQFLLIGLCILMMIDFNTFWNTLHMMLFPYSTNYILNTNDHILMVLFPPKLFLIWIILYLLVFILFHFLFRVIVNKVKRYD